MLCIAFGTMGKKLEQNFAAPRDSGRSASAGAIVLVGLMGVGKTTVGRRLAKRLNLPFVDADEEIEKAAGMAIAEIFERFGEPYFRDGERRVIARLVDGAPKIIATGGGAFMDSATRALILDKAIAVWLDADVDTLIARTAKRKVRPLLKNGNPGEILTNLAKQRNPVYAEAHLRIQSNDCPHERTVERIVAALNQCG